MIKQPYEDIIRGRLNAQMGDAAYEMSERFAESHQDASRRGLGEEFALALFAKACADDMRSRAERFWRTVEEVKINEAEDLDHISVVLKGIAREQFTRGDTFPAIEQFVSRHGPRIASFVEAQHAELRRVRDRLVRDLDSRIDALVYSHVKSISEVTVRPTNVDPRLVAREIQKRETQKANDSLWEKYSALKAYHPKWSERQLADELAKGDPCSSDTIRKKIRRLKIVGRKKRRPT